MAETLQQVFRLALKKELLKELKTNVKIYEENDTLYVELYYNNQLIFTYQEYDILDKIIEGTTAHMVAYSIKRQFRKHLLSKYFK